jgi:hypothetical protein
LCVCSLPAPLTVRLSIFSSICHSVFTLQHLCWFFLTLGCCWFYSCCHSSCLLLVDRPFCFPSSLLLALLRRNLYMISRWRRTLLANMNTARFRMSFLITDVAYRLYFAVTLCLSLLLTFVCDFGVHSLQYICHVSHRTAFEDSPHRLDKTKEGVLTFIN